MTPDKSSALVLELLNEQQTLTAISRFAQKHERHEIPLQSRFYRDLIPLTLPAPGQQYAFEVDLDRCSGCKACVAACHSLNGLEDDESWRSAGLLVHDGPAAPFQQTVTTACHHCVEPACLHGCPVLAYEKDPVTGIVQHLDDQCIGCQYCVLKCPYEVPRYSARLGIVRKCDMCTHRLHSGEAPACVQSCPNEAIRITTISSSELVEKYSAAAPAEAFLPSSPAPEYTIPTTIYRSARPLPAKLAAADERQVAPAESHWPLVLMLVLTQASAGLFIVQSYLLLSGYWDHDPGLLLVSAAVLGFSGLAASILHLGRPLYAWRAFIGVGRSWLSREIVMFSAFALSVLLLLAMEVLPQLFPPALLHSDIPWHSAAVLGALGVLCSILIYHDTPREFWNWKRTGPQFVGTMVSLGSAAALFCLPKYHETFCLALCIAGILKLSTNLGLLAPITDEEFTPLKRSGVLLAHQLRSLLWSRLAILALAGILAPLWWLIRGTPPQPFGTASLILILMAGEIIERLLFFRAVSQPKMPGGLR